MVLQAAFYDRAQPGGKRPGLENLPTSTVRTYLPGETVYTTGMSAQPPPAAEVWTINRLLRWTTDYLTREGVDDPRLSAELLLAHALGCAKIDLYARFDRVPDDRQRTTLRELVRRAADHQPIAYLVGTKEFYSLAFEVTPDVLIPRPETEALVEQAITRCRRIEDDPIHLLDLGTGSGCIALTVLTQVDTVRAVGSDVSPEALAVAARNARRHEINGRLTLVQADRLDLPADCVPAGGFHLIVSNPPYVAEGQAESLPENVRRHEPSLALYAGPDGLSFYRTLHRDAPALLQPGGTVLVEIGAGQARAVQDTFEADDVFAHTGTWRDPTDPHYPVMGV
ncbi:MAG: peptide chain release factor N(5)-glutamine methyltransferase, partial [Planctomycetes bacterium]|nr:peptide chain release factor N(5)-glutamine methyltransferase [Planctomycetota bacterium]